MSAEVEIICRLCGLSCEQSINIFDRLASVNMLQYKIMQLLDIAVGKSDKLPHSVCLSCVTKLDSLWCFKNTCHQVQIKLRKMIVVDQSNLPEYDRLQSELDRELLNLVNLNHKTLISSKNTSASDSSIFPRLSMEGGNVVYQHQTVSKIIESASVSVNVEEDVQIGYKTVSQSNPNSDDDSEGNIEDNLMSIVSEESANEECSVNIDVDNVSKNSEQIMCDDSSCVLDHDDLNARNRMPIVSEEDANAQCSVNLDVDINVSGDTKDCDSSSVLKQNDTNSRNSIESSSLDATSNVEIVQLFKDHYYRMETNSNSDLLSNRIPYLTVESQMGTKHMIYTVSPDISKFDNEHDYLVDKLYLELDVFDLENPNVGRILTEWLNNLLNGEISLMPYYFGWLDKSKLNVSFRCILCKRVISINKRFVMKHIADHLLWICPVCGKFCRTITNLRNHLHQHSSPTFECSTCGENLGSDIEKYKVHKRGHYKFRCPPCQFECCDEEKWLKHLEKDRKNNELCSPDCSLFYESIDKFRDHVLALATLGGYVCGACGMAYHCEEYLKLHLKVHGLEHGSKTTCEESLENNDTSFRMKLDSFANSSNEKRFDTMQKILANEIDVKEFQNSRIMTGGKVTTAFICFKCGRGVKTEKKFRIHIENHISMTCYHCKRDMRELINFKTHLKRCSFKKRKCVSCKNEIWLNTSKEYIEHVTLHQKRKICIYCQVIKNHPQQLSRHIESVHVSEPKSWFCDICNETLVVSYKQLNHFRSRHMADKHPEKLDTYICEVCGKTFKLKGELNKHKLLHKTVDKPNFICAYCNKNFGKKESLISHIQRHMNEKSFECAICKKCFNRFSSLDKHRKDMHSVKKHVCHVCDKRFTYPSALNDHMRRAHEKCSFRKPGISADC
ncbi:zinc finger protein 26 isoform X2 [Nilaparvata lugens]|uniref:zinc finger protein 26 isoform X2 n=1 Tax=Nilaparvata lugens TaxID=108931 RepID=UPI00193D6A5D|nr:zinc finger protein 26 isoform X2 [Nilaparvata lugens]XP_039295631.1 zinc finger protein 26 isoform X3 [Nilaparvata lugens]XP_039295632.1 zinc finger protein 26 isoform X2 [Nilaparvata lugens]XP_039295633.1 zinc finger protein 26 isoform X2 [Nilaparvata lugens]